MKYNLLSIFTILQVLLISAHVHAELPKQLQVVSNGGVPIVDVQGYDRDKFTIFGVSEDDEFFATDSVGVGIYDMTGKLRDIIKSKRKGKNSLRDLHSVKKVNGSYYGLYNSCLVESSGEYWNIDCKGYENKSIIGYGYDKKGNVYSFHKKTQPYISMKRPGNKKQEKFPIIPQLDGKKGNWAQNIQYYLTSEGISVIVAHINKEYTVLVSKDHTNFKKLEHFKDYFLHGITSTGHLLVNKKNSSSFDDLATMTIDGVITSLNLLEDKKIKEHSERNRWSTIEYARINPNNDLLCIHVGSRKELFCKKGLDSQFQLITKNASEVDNSNGIVVRL